MTKKFLVTLLLILSVGKLSSAGDFINFVGSETTGIYGHRYVDFTLELPGGQNSPILRDFKMWSRGMTAAYLMNFSNIKDYQYDGRSEKMILTDRDGYRVIVHLGIKIIDMPAVFGITSFGIRGKFITAEEYSNSQETSQKFKAWRENALGADEHWGFSF